jgi:hypothetical protein
VVDADIGTVDSSRHRSIFAPERYGGLVRVDTRTESRRRFGVSAV